MESSARYAMEADEFLLLDGKNAGAASVAAESNDTKRMNPTEKKIAEQVWERLDPAKPCSNCHGLGQVPTSVKLESDFQTFVDWRNCKQCNGTGKEPREIE